MSILEYLDKENLHHAYLIEGGKEYVLPQVFEFIEGLGIKTVGNGVVNHISLDTFKIDDARNLKSYAIEKSLGSSKKVFIISVNSFLLEAQNSLLKLFEEPIENTHFFLIIPDKNSLLDTFVSRFFFISEKNITNQDTSISNVKKFIKMPLKDRLDFIKDLLKEEEEVDEEGLESGSVESSRTKALKFINTLESTLHEHTPRTVLGTSIFEHIWKVREFLRMPGSSAKMLLESIALAVPNFKN
jgi:DNA polymerase-3 subunit delta'